MRILSMLVLALLGTLPAAAENVQGISRRQAQEEVGASEAAREKLLAAFPRLRSIDIVVSRDCANRNRPQTAESNFCRCAAAVIWRLWGSGADPNMVPRLQAFVEGRNNMAAATFAAYQGPELYRSLCLSAGRG